MGFDADDAAGFGVDITTSGSVEMGGAQFSGQMRQFYMLNIAQKKHIVCNDTYFKTVTTDQEGKKTEAFLPGMPQKGCMHLDATDVTKESVSQCINTQAAKLEVTDDNDL